MFIIRFCIAKKIELPLGFIEYGLWFYYRKPVASACVSRMLVKYSRTRGTRTLNVIQLRVDFISNPN
jgi:hypothetical protein